MKSLIAKRALTKAEAFPVFTENIGSRAKVGRFVDGRVIGGMDGGTADLVIPVSGSKGHGKLAAWMQNTFGGWHVCSMDLVMDDGKHIDLMPDKQAHCERE